MSENKKIIIWCFAIFVVFCLLITGCSPTRQLTQEQQDILAVSDITIADESIVGDTYKEDGYEEFDEWFKDFVELKTSYIGKAEQDIETWGDWLTEEDKGFLENFADNIIMAKNLTDAREWDEQYKEIINTAKQNKADAEASEYYISENYYEEDYSDYSGSSGYSGYNTPTSGLTPSGGVNYYNGRTETYYSSNVLYHYRTNEWTVDDQGFYRTSEGYYVVAASDMPEGTTFEGSMGTCVVLDSGCSPGVTDYYVAW